MLPILFRTFLCTLALGSAAVRPATPSPAPWNDSGHRILSLVAWADLDAGLRDKVTTLLQQHPRYQEDLLAGLPEGSDAAATAKFAFATAATWPDLVRTQSHPMHRVAHHPKWHYLDIPFVLGGQPVPPAEPAPADGGPGDAVAALGKCVADLGNDKLPASDRAVALCWVLHLTEDLHQPLHACTLYSPQFPKGDKGGNSFLVVRYYWDQNSRVDLHTLWDGLLGGYREPGWDECMAAGLAARQDLRREKFAKELAVRDPGAWAKESHDLAVKHVYLDGTLVGATAGGPADTKAPLLPKDYVANAERMLLPRAAVAAHRVADLLQRTLAAK